MSLRTLAVSAGFAMLIASALSGCSVFGDSSDGKSALLGRPGTNPEQVQAELMAFADTFISTISQQWNQADAAAAATPSAPVTPGAAPVKAAGDRGRRASLEIKIANVTGALAIATDPNPLVGLADMITMITLERMILEDPWAAESLGPEKAARVVAAYKEQETKAWRIAEHVFAPDQQKDLRAIIEKWRKDHPTQRYIAGVRLEDFARDRGTVDLGPDQSGPGSLLALVGLDPLANLDPTVREVQRSRLLAERIFFYTQHAPSILKWQTESLYTGLLQTPEVKQAMSALADVSDAANNVADAADQLRKDLAKERHDALVDLFTQFQKERADAMDQFFKGVANERTQALRDIDDGAEKLGGTLKQVREAAEATEKLTTSLNSTIKSADALVARFAPPPGTVPVADTSPKKDPLAEYREAAAATSQTVDKLTLLADRVDKLLASPDLDARTGKLRTVVDSLQGGVQQTVDHAFWWLAILAVVSAFCLGAAISLGLSGHKAMERRSAAKRRASRKAK
jgi:hypothetical protein